MSNSNDVSGTFDDLVSAFNRREWRRSQMLAGILLQRMPTHPLLHYMAGVSSLELRQMPKALAHLRRASEAEPDRLDFAVTFAKALSMARLHEEALAVVGSMRDQAWNDANALDAIGVVYTRANRHAEAIDLFRRLVELSPHNAHHRYNLGAALVIAGDIEQSEHELETCLELDPRYWRAHLSIAQVRRQVPDRNHVTRLQALLASSGTHPAAATNLHLALAKEFEDLGMFPQALTHLKQGKSAAARELRYDFSQDEALFKALQQAFPVAVDSTGGSDSRKPIFVIGMPRSGTTLVERILSSHPDVHSAGELMDFGVNLKRASGSRTPLLIDVDTVAASADLDWKRLGEAYLASTGSVTGHTPRFVDKLPHNFLYAGFIARAFPKAKIICLRRHPMDTCLSNFRQLFAIDAPFFGYSFDAVHTARYYALFDHLVAHWRSVLPGRIMEIAYEDIVADQEKATRKLLAYCDLTWDPACLSFERNVAPVTTASAVQVRSPIYASAVARWKRYEGGLDDVRDVLRSAGVDFPG